MQRTGGLREALWWENKRKGWCETPGLTQADNSEDILGFSLVCLVAVPHFDSPFDETDHVFVLNREGAGEVRSGGKTAKRANMKLLGQCQLLLPDLKEGERCPLEETLCIANFSVKLLWGENYGSVSKLLQTHTHTHSMFVYICLNETASLWFTGLYWPSVKFLEKLDFLRCLMRKNKNPLDCFSRYISCHFTSSFFFLWSVTQLLSSKEGTLS